MFNLLEITGTEKLDVCTHCALVRIPPVSDESIFTGSLTNLTYGAEVFKDSDSKVWLTNCPSAAWM